MSTDDRLKGEWSLRIARRLLDANAITRVIEPAIEDLRHEAVAARGAMRSLCRPMRAYWGLWKAIIVCAAVESVSVARPTLDGIVFRVMVGLPIIMALLIAPVITCLIQSATARGLAASSAVDNAAGIRHCSSSCLLFRSDPGSPSEPTAARLAGNRRSLDGMHGHRAHRDVSCRASGQPGISTDSLRAAARGLTRGQASSPGPGELMFIDLVRQARSEGIEWRARLDAVSTAASRFRRCPWCSVSSLLASPIRD